MDEVQEFFTFEDALAYLGVEEGELRRMVSQGMLRAQRDGNTLNFLGKDVDAMKKQLGNERQEQAPTSPAPQAPQDSAPPPVGESVGEEKDLDEKLPQLLRPETEGAAQPDGPAAPQPLPVAEDLREELTRALDANKRLASRNEKLETAESEAAKREKELRQKKMDKPSSRRGLTTSLIALAAGIAALVVLTLVLVFSPAPSREQDKETEKIVAVEPARKASTPVDLEAFKAYERKAQADAAYRAAVERDETARRKAADDRAEDEKKAAETEKKAEEEVFQRNLGNMVNPVSMRNAAHMSVQPQYVKAIRLLIEKNWVKDNPELVEAVGREIATFGMEAAMPVVMSTSSIPS